MSATAIRDKNIFNPTINAVNIYGEFHYAAKAKATLERAARRTVETTLWGAETKRLSFRRDST